MVVVVVLKSIEMRIPQPWRVHLVRLIKVINGGGGLND